MADIKLTVSGDASNAQDALRQAAEATNALTEKLGKNNEETAKSIVKWQAIADGIKKAASAAVDFGKGAIKAFAESERITKQLARATGELADAFDAQAQALKDKYAVDDDVIKQQQILLAQWGAAPKDISAATEAILDYATATGKDAVGATQEFIRSVEMGGKMLERVGVHYDATGRRTEDVRRATMALTKAFGGAAAADEDTLTGHVRRAENALSDFKKSIGEFFATAEAKYGVLRSLSEAFDGLRTAITGGDEQQKRYKEKGALLDELNNINSVLGQLKTMTGEEQVAWDNANKEKIAGYADINEMLSRRLVIMNRLAELEAAEKALSGLGSAKPIGGIDDTTAYGRQLGKSDKDTGADTLKKAFAANEKELFGSIEVGEVGALEYQKELVLKRYQVLADDKDIKDSIAKMEAEYAKKALEAAEKEAKKWAQVGETLGAAFVNALTAQLNQLTDGGEFDLAGFIAGLLPMIGGALFGPLGGAIGGLAGAGIKFASSRFGAKYHDGAWVGVPRFHGGGWPGVGPDEVPAVLQMGERVLSRSEVARAGGPDAVERLASGDGGGARFVVHVSAVDAKGVREFFEAQGGRGFYDALRTGQGMLTPVFGGG